MEYRTLESKDIIQPGDQWKFSEPIPQEDEPQWVEEKFAGAFGKTVEQRRKWFGDDLNYRRPVGSSSQ
jgi:hypothetical protein